MIKLQPLLLVVCLLLAGPTSGEELLAATGDRLVVTITNETDLSGNYTVDQEGNIFLPMVGKVAVKGLTPEKVRDELEKRVRKFVRDPQVSVEILERAQITVGVTGLVGKPGPVKIARGSRLLDAIAEAGGIVTPELVDAKNLTLQRRRQEKVRKIDLDRLNEGEGGLNVELQDGDQVIVPRMPMITVRVLGAVGKPGELLRKVTEPITLQEAILTAGNVTPDLDDRGKIQLLRKGTSAPELISYQALRTGTVPNPLLKDGDTVTVPAFPKMPVTVFGYVTKPGISELREGATVFEAVAAAGGFAMDADQRAVFITNLGDEQNEVRRLDLTKPDALQASATLKPGDKVFVAQAVARRYGLAGGGITTPGLYSFPADPAQKLFLAEALAQGGGIIDRAKKKSGVLVRKDPGGGKPTVIPLDLEGLLVKKDPKANVEILVNDVLYVDAEPERERKPRVLDRILGIAGAFFGGF